MRFFEEEKVENFFQILEIKINKNYIVDLDETTLFYLQIELVLFYKRISLYMI